MGAKNIKKYNMKFIEISSEEQRDILGYVQENTGLKSAIIEKDWWVTAVLRAIFMLPYSKHISFKGGTSLSKCWGLIERMSEDIDIAIDREYLGFGGELSKTQISDKLRRASCSFVREQMQYDIAKQLETNGISNELFEVSVNVTPITTTDPEIIMVTYKSVTEDLPYIMPSVKIEVSGRSMTEPIAPVQIESIIDKVIPQAPFKEDKFSVRAVIPQRTFLEKLFLLHEEFAKEQIRVDRMTRHLYDIVKIIETPIAKEALNDDELYQSVIEHRRLFIGLKGFDYSTLNKKTLNIVPSSNVIDKWENDYKSMQEDMIYGQSLSFRELIDKVIKLNHDINQM